MNTHSTLDSTDTRTVQPASSPVPAPALPQDQAPAGVSSPASSGSASSPESAARRRRGRRPAGAGTRDQILGCARKLFTAHGYQRVSLRAIAREADVDPALVHHYFHGKPAIFLATLADVGIDLNRHLAGLAEVPRDQLGAELVRRSLDMCSDAPSQPTTLGTSTPPLQALREFFAIDVFPRLPITAEDGTADSLRAEMVASQVLGLLFSRQVLRAPQVHGRSIEDLTRLYGPSVQQIIDAGPA